MAEVLALQTLTKFGQIFEKISKRFSLAEVPLVYEVLPMLARLRRDLMQMKSNESLPNIIRIAVMASLLILEKYDERYEQTEVYKIAVGMCWGSDGQSPAE